MAKRIVVSKKATLKNTQPKKETAKTEPLKTKPSAKKPAKKVEPKKPKALTRTSKTIDFENEVYSGGSRLMVITEKPSVAADIARALGGFTKKTDHYSSSQYVVTWALGHLLELLEPQDIDPKYKSWLLQDLPVIPKVFEYKPKTGQSERLSFIRRLAKQKDISGIVNACDAGREGELIFREIYDYCETEKPIQRLWLQSLTTESISQAFKQLKPGSQFDHLADAARCRAESDWLIGMNATRAMTRRLQTRSMSGVWSVGRVQTPTLTLIVQRELEHLQHIPVPYFTIEAQFEASDHTYKAQWFTAPNKETKTAQKADKTTQPEDDAELQAEKDNWLLNHKEVERICDLFARYKDLAKAWEVRRVSKESAPQLFDLTLLQREANRRFGMTATRTLQAAQRLYEKHKVLTYPRSDSRYLPEDYPEQVKKVLAGVARFSPNYKTSANEILARGLLNTDRIFNNAQVSDHFAIIPTGQAPAGLEGDDERIFDLVVRRFLAAFMPPAVWDKVERVTQIQSEMFRTRVQSLNTPGWRSVYGFDVAGDEKRLPPLLLGAVPATTPAQGVEVMGLHIDPTSHVTKPPARYSEARLLGLMEHCGRTVEDEDVALALKDKGLGTVATRADIIENLIIKEYALRCLGGRFLKATSKGMRLIDTLSRIPIEMLTKVELTGEMEHDLKMVERGQKKRTEFMANMSTFTNHVVEKAKTFSYDDLYKDQDPIGTCPVCQKDAIHETPWSYKCASSACGFQIWKEKNGRYVDRNLVARVVQKRIVGPLEFIHPQGVNTYEEFLTIDPQRGIVFCSAEGVPKEGSEAAPAVVLHEELMPQTFLGVPGKIQVTDRFYTCVFGEVAPATAEEEAPATQAKTKSKKATPKNQTESKKAKVKKTKVAKKVMSRMPSVLCGREMTLEEYKQFIASGQTPPILDFKSKKGRSFAAELHLKTNGNFEFKFVSKKKIQNEAA